PPADGVGRQARPRVGPAGRRAAAGAGPAIGSGQEGELFAVAVSPDGHFVVTGGWTGFEWEKANSLYVFETGTGELVRRIGGLPQVIDRLAWSPGGHYVAVGLAGA